MKINNNFKSNSIILLLILTVLILDSCNTLVGYNGVSNNIQESKQRDVFVANFMVKQNPYIINDTLKLHIGDIWLEKHWKYKKDNSESKILEGYQLIVETNENDIMDITFNWSIGIESSKYFRRCDNDSMISDL